MVAPHWFHYPFDEQKQLKWISGSNGTVYEHGCFKLATEQYETGRHLSSNTPWYRVLELERQYTESGSKPFGSPYPES